MAVQGLHECFKHDCHQEQLVEHNVKNDVADGYNQGLELSEDCWICSFQWSPRSKQYSTLEIRVPTPQKPLFTLPYHQQVLHSQWYLSNEQRGPPC